MTAESCLEDGKSVRNQYLAAIVINIMSFCHGCGTGWTSPFLPIMSGEDSPLDSPLTPVQASFVASAVCIGGLVGTPVYGGLADKFGRKKAVLFSAIPYVLAWFMKLTWRTATGIIIARIVSGFGGAGPFLVGPTYCVEIASARTRGALGSLMVFSINAGILAMYIMGAYLNYNTCLSIMITVPIIFFVIMLKMPETPVFLVKQKKDEEAMKAIAWLRREPLDGHVVRRVLSKLKHENQLGLKKSEDLEKVPTTQKEVSSWKFLITSVPTLRAFAVCFCLLTIQVCTGIFAIVTYANDIFRQAGSNLSPGISSIIVGALQLIGSTIGSFTIEKTGRKVLLISSCTVVSLGSAVIGTYFYARHYGYDVSELGWIPVTALSLFVSFFAMGIGPVPYLLLSEIIMVQVVAICRYTSPTGAKPSARGLVSSIMLSWVWIASFLIAQLFNALVEFLGNYTVFWIFSMFSCLGILVTVMFLPETKGRSFESILAYYSGKKSKKIPMTVEIYNLIVYIHSKFGLKKMDSKTGEKTSVTNQYRAAIAVNMLSFYYGCALGWVSPSIPILSGPDTPLDSPLTKTQASLVASLICIGGLIGTSIFGYLSVRYGRRTALLCSIVPALISWGVKLTWKTAQGLYLARIFTGLGGAAVFLIVPVYCIEIASLSSRGILGSSVFFSVNCGIVAMYIMGACLNYHTVLIITFCLPVVAFIFIFISPESPVYLVKQRKYKKATKALAWLRREPEDSPIIIKELELLKHNNNLSSSCCSSEIEKQHLDKINEISEISPWKFFITSKPTKNAFAVCFALITVQCMIGIFAVITFANDIFQETGSNLSPNVNSIILGVLQLLGSIIASSLIGRVGRRILLISSCMIISLSMSIIGFYFFLREKGYDVSIVGWIPVAALSFVMCSFPIGIGPIPFMLSSEIIMIKARGIAEPLIGIWFWILSFLTIQTFSMFVSWLGIYTVFWIFSAFGSLGVIITLLFLPETRGNSFENILDFYSGKRQMNAVIKNEKPNSDSF
ncbi:uncharacterized protein LOC143909189 [Arctopsyche grandis]|uniref:uncharacterized protein LOC143909189 n=1 Tax=Arctopsyche grandis TaxID=121162 RepID=UPI00406D7BA5